MCQRGNYMSIHINEVLDYLDEQLVCQRADGMQSLMEMLYEAYTVHDSGGSQNEVTAFAQGVLTGMLLMTEVNRLP